MSIYYCCYRCLRNIDNDAHDAPFTHCHPSIYLLAWKGEQWMEKKNYVFDFECESERRNVTWEWMAISHSLVSLELEDGWRICCLQTRSKKREIRDRNRRSSNQSSFLGQFDLFSSSVYQITIKLCALQMTAEQPTLNGYWWAVIC